MSPKCMTVFAVCWILAAPLFAEEKEDKSLLLDKPSGKVVNGSAFDKASLDGSDIRKLVVPEGAEVIRTGAGKQIQLYLHKAQQFRGHPPRPMNISITRAYLGCATKQDGTTLLLATFGEFRTKEGGATVKLVVMVPEGIAVEKAENHSGPDSIAHPAAGAKVPELKDTYWYSPTVPGEGWKTVKTEPDPDHHASKPAKK